MSQHLGLVVIVAVLGVATTASAGPELSIVEIKAPTTKPVIGTTVEVEVVVRNTAPKQRARAAAGAQLVGAKTVIGGAQDIASGATATLRVRVPIEGRNVKSDRFTTRVFIADPAVAADANMVQQLWKDNDLKDNSRELVIPVEPAARYDLTVRVVEVVNRCAAYDKTPLRFFMNGLVIDQAVQPDEVKAGPARIVNRSYVPCAGNQNHHLKQPSPPSKTTVFPTGEPVDAGLVFKIKGMSIGCSLTFATSLIEASRTFNQADTALNILVGPQAQVRKRLVATSRDKQCPNPYDVVVEVTSGATGSDLR